MGSPLHSDELEMNWSEYFKTPSISINQLGYEGSEGQSISKSWGESFRELSPFTEGAAIKRIHWPKLINSGELIVKSYDLPHKSTLTILLDETASMTTGKQWRFARILAVKLAVGVLKSGHQVQLIIDRDECLQSSQIITRLDQFIATWDRIITYPSGSGTSQSDRKKKFNKRVASDFLVCLSDAIVTTPSKHMDPQPSEMLISVLEQLSGLMLHQQKILYICLIDDIADHVPLNRVLKSAEYKLSPLKGPINEDKAEKALAKLQQYRQRQKELLKKQSLSSWIDYRVHSPIEPQFNKIVQMISYL